MKVTCCECGREYIYPDECQVGTVDLGKGCIADHIRRPHCGLEHLVIWAKYGWAKRRAT